MLHKMEGKSYRIFLLITLTVTKVFCSSTITGVYKLQDFTSVKVDCSDDFQYKYNKYSNYYYEKNLFESALNVKTLQIGECRGSRDSV